MHLVGTSLMLLLCFWAAIRKLSVLSAGFRSCRTTQVFLRCYTFLSESCVAAAAACCLSCLLLLLLLPAHSTCSCRTPNGCKELRLALLCAASASAGLPQRAYAHAHQYCLFCILALLLTNAPPLP
jgi:hypothetical protein